MCQNSSYNCYRKNNCVFVLQSLHQTAYVKWISGGSARQRALHTQCPASHTTGAQVNPHKNRNANKCNRCITNDLACKNVSCRSLFFQLKIAETWLHQSENQQREVPGDPHPGCKSTIRKRKCCAAPGSGVAPRVIGATYRRCVFLQLWLKNDSAFSLLFISIPVLYATGMPSERTVRSRWSRKRKSKQKWKGFFYSFTEICVWQKVCL